jgi:hypothetical protein
MVAQASAPGCGAAVPGDRHREGVARQQRVPWRPLLLRLQRRKGRTPLFLSVGLSAKALCLGFSALGMRQGCRRLHATTPKPLRSSSLVKDLFRDLANSNLQRWFNGISCTRRRPRRAPIRQSKN